VIDILGHAVVDDPDNPGQPTEIKLGSLQEYNKPQAKYERDDGSACLHLGESPALHNRPQPATVLQDWVASTTFKMQSVLMAGLRGPDTHACPRIKEITRWLRGLILKPGDPDNMIFMNTELPPRISEKGPTAKEIEFCTMHFFVKLTQTLEIVGIYHPDVEIKFHAQQLYLDLCTLIHVQPEEPMQLYNRLKQKSWPTGKQPADATAAMHQLYATNTGGTPDKESSSGS
jgi:hypothetical protein